MRCLALTSERRRCAATADETSGYCLEHESLGTAVRLAVRGIKREGGWRRIFQGFGTGFPAIPDHAKAEVPGWIKRSSTPTIISDLLPHTEMQVRWYAAFVLRKRRDPGAIESLWHVLQTDPVSLVRQQAAVALGKIGIEAVVNPLVESLVHDADAGVRQACAIALGNLGLASAAADIVFALEQEKAVFVRWDCVLALGQIGDHSADALLAELAQNDRTEAVRRACNDALEKIRNRFG